MKKIFKTIALATAIAVGAATMTGCPNPVMPEDNTEQDNNDPGNGGSTENPSDPQTQTIILSTNPHETRPGYLAPDYIHPNGIILDRFGQAQENLLSSIDTCNGSSNISRASVNETPCFCWLFKSFTGSHSNRIQ